MTTDKADLHMHGPIGFEPHRLRQQGYEGKHLLKLIADQCFKKNITICALTSESDQVDEEGVILRNIPAERLGFLVNNYMTNLPHGYSAKIQNINITQSQTPT